MTETREKTIYEVLEGVKNTIAEVSEEICDKYCMYSQVPMDEKCTECPLDKLYWN